MKDAVAEAAQSQGSAGVSSAIQVHSTLPCPKGCVMWPRQAHKVRLAGSGWLSMAAFCSACSDRRLAAARSTCTGSSVSHVALASHQPLVVLDVCRTQASQQTMSGHRHCCGDILLHKNTLIWKVSCAVFLELCAGFSVRGRLH